MEIEEERKFNKIVQDGCMITYSGIIFDLMNPDINKIHLADIAHGLAFNSRWNGATKAFYSIAEHSLRVADRVPEEAKLSALFHDSEESYWGDIIRPLKNIIAINSPEIIQRMRDLRYLIFEKFNIKYFDTKEEDNFEVVQDYEELVKSHKRVTLSPRIAERIWLEEVQKRLNK